MKLTKWHDQIFAVLSKATCLRELELVYIDTFRNSELMKRLFETCKTLKKLKIVLLPALCYFDGNFLEFGKSIEHLSIEGGEITKEGFTNIVQMKNLKNICLTKGKWRYKSNFHTEHLIALTKNCSKLESLIIGRTNIESLSSVKEMKSIFELFFKTFAKQLKCYDFDI